MPTAQDVDLRITEFRKDLRALAPRQIVQRHITFGETAVLPPDQHFELRTTVADKFLIHPHAVVVVGSAKLGFSIKPSRRYGHFGDRSDIDLALVSSDLFLRYWKYLQDYVDSGGYWERLGRLQEKLFDGWIRPDLMPPANSHKLTSDWWEFFRESTASGRFGRLKISAGIYLDWSCLERYQAKAVALCRDELVRS